MHTVYLFNLSTAKSYSENKDMKANAKLKLARNLQFSVTEHSYPRLVLFPLRISCYYYKCFKNKSLDI